MQQCSDNTRLNLEGMEWNGKMIGWMQNFTGQCCHCMLPSSSTNKGKEKTNGDMRTIETKEAEKVLQKKRNKDVEDRGCGNKITKEAYESCAANCFVYFADS